MKSGSMAGAARRHWALGCLVLLVALVVSMRVLFNQLGGASSMSAMRDPKALSGAAQELLDSVYDGIDPERLFDHHTHLVGLGQGSDCWVNPRLLSWSHPKDHLRFMIYKDSAGITQEATADRDYVDVLSRLAGAQPHPSRHLLLAFDYRY
ncbi:MAG: hypothetical protein ACI841_003477, partial [Planctomycetota bacterium]